MRILGDALLEVEERVEIDEAVLVDRRLAMDAANYVTEQNQQRQQQKQGEFRWWLWRRHRHLQNMNHKLGALVVCHELRACLLAVVCFAHAVTRKLSMNKLMSLYINNIRAIACASIGKYRSVNYVKRKG